MDINTVVYKSWGECTPEEQKIQLAILERCYGSKPDFLYFLEWCKIIGTPTFENPGGILPFRLLPHNRELVEAFLTKRLISVMKSRQIYVSYTMMAYCLWFAMAHIGASIMLFSVREPESQELLRKAMNLYKFLPPILQLEVKPSAELLVFPKRDSRIRAFPSTESAGVSYTASIIVWDEHVEHDYDIENYTSSKPTIESSGGQGISIFTPNKTKLNKLAFSLWKNAPQNGFFPLFFPYNVLPERDEVWYEDKKGNLTAEELGTLSPDMYMESNYPRSVAEALRPPQTMRAFDTQVIDEMLQSAKLVKPIKKSDLDNLICHVWQDEHVGGHYIAASDTGHGSGLDYSVTTIMSLPEGIVVADVFSNLLRPEEFAQQSVNLLNLYHNPLWFIEDNEWGGTTISTAKALGYKNFGYIDSKKTNEGFHTDEKTRYALWGSLIPAFNNRQIILFNSSGIGQFNDIIRNTEKNGRIEALGNRHDDYPIAVGICWLKKNEVSLGVRNKPIIFDTLGYYRRQS